LWNGAGAARGAYDISLSRNRILIKLLYDLNPGNARDGLPDDWPSAVWDRD